MNMLNELVPLLNALPQEKKDYLISLAKADAALFEETLQEMLRLKGIMRTVDRRAWENWKQGQENCLQILLQGLDAAKRSQEAR